jgi:hypothetical protein
LPQESRISASNLPQQYNYVWLQTVQ